MTWYPTQSYYPDTEPTNPCPILIMPITWLRSDKYQFHKSSVWLDHRFESTCETRALPIRPPVYIQTRPQSCYQKALCRSVGVVDIKYYYLVFVFIGLQTDRLSLTPTPRPLSITLSQVRSLDTVYVCGYPRSTALSVLRSDSYWQDLPGCR